MRTLLLSNSYPPVLGGLQTVVHHLATGLVHKGYELQVVTNRYPRTLPSIESLENVPIRRLLFLTPSLDYLKQRRIDLFVASLGYYPTVLLEMKRLVERIQPTVINLHYPLSQIPFVLALRQRYRFRLVVSLHGDEILPWVREERDCPPLRAILRQADAVTACSHWLLEQATAWEPAVRAKGIAIHNGIDPDRFVNQCSYSHPRPYIFAFGRFTYQKGFDLLLAAFAQVAAQFPQVDLILAGAGEALTALQAQVSQAGLEERVYFYGRATPQEVVQLLKGCTFVVIPSRWEPFGIVALEGMAAGKPMLATNVGGLPELLCHSPAFVQLAPPTVEGLADGLRQMLNRIEECPPSRAAINHLLTHFSWQQIVTRYEEVFLQD